jgi:ribonuclease D
MLRDLQRQQIIALDSEWKPTQNINNTAALLQLATHKDIYLLDLILLQISDNDWWQLGNNVFNNDNILKLGECDGMRLGVFCFFNCFGFNRVRTIHRYHDFAKNIAGYEYYL